MRIKGGLGNQLFQYAAAYAISKRLQQPFQFNPSFTSDMTPRNYRLRDLNCNVDSVILDNNLPLKVNLIKNKYINKVYRILNFSLHKCGDYLYFLETKGEIQPDFFTINEKNVFLDGYFQSEIYFKEYRNDLLKQITPNYEADVQFLSVLDEIKSVNSVAVHVRRSDFIKDNNPFHYILDIDYYNKAIDFIRNNIDNPQFFWFSDDMKWVKDNIGVKEDFHFVSIHTQHGDIDDLMLMKYCNHIITANSTFSWWAAWLNTYDESIRICPLRRYGNLQMIPDNWIKIGDT